MAAAEKGKEFKVAMSPNEEYRRVPSPSPTPTSSVLNHPLVPVLSYCFASILMTTTNKYVLSGYSFNLNFFLLMVQSLVAVVAIQICKQLKVITFRDFNMDEAKKCIYAKHLFRTDRLGFPISLLLVLMTYTSSKALQYLSIPVYTIFKNLTIILIAYGEVLWFGGSVTGMTLFSFGLMVLSSIIAAWADVQAAASHLTSSVERSDSLATLGSGYLWMGTNCITTALYVLGMRKRIKITNFKDFDTMFYNNLLTVPILLLCSFLLEDWSSINIERNFPPDSRQSVILAMVFSGLSTVGISYTSAWCVRVTSSTTYSFVGSLNKLPIAIAGIVFFEAPVTFYSITAIIVGFISGLVYAVAKQQQQQPKQQPTLPVANPATSASSQSYRDSMSTGRS